MEQVTGGLSFKRVFSDIMGPDEYLNFYIHRNVKKQDCFLINNADQMQGKYQLRQDIIPSSKCASSAHNR